MKKTLLAGLGLLLVPFLRAELLFCSEPSVQVFETGHDAYEVSCRFSVNTDSKTAWAVLSDYDGIGKYVTSLKSSRTVERKADHVMVEQVGQAGLWFVQSKFEVLLKVYETPGTKIDFEDVSKKSFQFYRGSWEILNGQNGVQIVYKLSVVQQTRFPMFVTRGFLRKSIAELIGQVKNKIDGRGS